jgi:hypothetical protein
VKSTFTPWDSDLPDQSSQQFFNLSQGPGGSACPQGALPFAPDFEAGVTDKTAGDHAPFGLKVTRRDGEQTLSDLSVTTPPGFSATLKGVSYCPEAAIAELENPLYTGLAEQAVSSCPGASQIGTAIAAAGAGTHPLYVPGKVYLAGPYKGAPLSLVAVIPALSGPYDLGVVAVRAAISLDPYTAQVTTSSDPLPQIIAGIPLRTRSIQINLDRPNFALNPTNCNPSSVKAAISGSEGAVFTPAYHFQVADCAPLPFSPKLAIRLAGKMRRAATPALRATLTAPPGQANIATTTVTMPRTIFLDNAHINGPCTRSQFAQNACPRSSVLGSARAVTPLLAEPLQGPVYLMSGFGHRLPDLVAALKGQVDVNLDGKISSYHQRLRTTFAAVPDVPVTSFSLKLAGGKKGLLEISAEHLCGEKPKAGVLFGGQNGKRQKRSVRLRLPCHKHGGNHSRHARKRSASAGKGDR